MGRVQELQELLEKQSFELSQARERLVTLTAAVAELEEDLDTARRDLIKSEELSVRRQRDLREVGKGLACPLVPGAGLQPSGGQPLGCPGWREGRLRTGKCDLTLGRVRRGQEWREGQVKARHCGQCGEETAVGGEVQTGRGREK